MTQSLSWFSGINVFAFKETWSSQIFHSSKKRMHFAECSKIHIQIKFRQLGLAGKKRKKEPRTFTNKTDWNNCIIVTIKRMPIKNTSLEKTVLCGTGMLQGFLLHLFGTTWAAITRRFTGKAFLLCNRFISLPSDIYTESKRWELSSEPASPKVPRESALYAITAMNLGKWSFQWLWPLEFPIMSSNLLNVNIFSFKFIACSYAAQIYCSGKSTVFCSLWNKPTDYAYLILSKRYALTWCYNVQIHGSKHRKNGCLALVQYPSCF